MNKVIQTILRNGTLYAQIGGKFVKFTSLNAKEKQNVIDRLLAEAIVATPSKRDELMDKLAAAMKAE